MFNASKAFLESTKITDEQRLVMIRQDMIESIEKSVKHLRKAVIEAVKCGVTEAHTHFYKGNMIKYGDKIYTAIQYHLIPEILDLIAEKFKLLGYKCEMFNSWMYLRWDNPNPENIVIKELEMDEIVTSCTSGFMMIKDN
jgi:hypothetical protein